MSKQYVTSIDFMKEVIITSEMCQRAKYISDQYKNKLTDSIRNGEGTFAGSLGEEMVLAEFPFVKRANTYNFDCLFGDKRLEVKTKERSVMPLPHYDASVNKVHGKQQADFYIFTSILKNFERGWIIGYIKTDIFWELAELKTGHESNMKNPFAANTYNLPYCQLLSFK